MQAGPVDRASVRIPADGDLTRAFHDVVSLNGLEGEVTYFCFIESSILSVPHMEPLAAEDPDSAAAEAGVLLAQHASGYAAHVFMDDRKIVTLRCEREGTAFGRVQATARSRSASSDSRGTTA